MQAMPQQKFSIKKRIASFKHAFSGFQVLLKEEHNARIHFLAALGALGAAWFFQIEQIEWIILLFAIAIVFCAELLNSAIENIADYISPEKHPRIKVIKDYGAAAVLAVSFASLGAGLIIFLPRILMLL